jgi:hypothetical protein
MIPGLSKLKIIFAVMAIQSSSSYAQNPTSPLGNSSVGFDLGGKLFFDAKTTGFSADGKSQIFKGEVVAIGAGVLITADQIVFDSASNSMEATGHVLVISRSQIFTGERILYRIDSSDFRIESALMVSNDSAQVEKISRRVLGFTPKEVEFETQRQERLNEINRKKVQVRNDFRASVGQVEAHSADLIEQYALLLEQEEITRNSENPALAKLSQDRRKVYETRRKYWEDGRKTSSIAVQPAYFRIEGKTLQRTDDNDYVADDALWSPCKCEPGESPAWGFRANKVKAQVGGYVDFHHPVLEIRGLPILYLPYLKLPVKSERQSGFLMPSLASTVDSGNSLNIPLYIAISDEQDATISSEFIEKRGTKLTLEWRWAPSQNSYWQLGVSGIRDRSWLAERETRVEIREAKIAAGQDPGRDYVVPNNTWRSSKQWSGLSILGPRLSFVSNGQYYSDHRYVDDLSSPDSLKDALDYGNKATYLVPARAQFNYSGRDFYAGLSSAFADNFSSELPFSGLQMPVAIDLQSRVFRLTPRNWKSPPIYGEIAQSSIQLREFAMINRNDPAVNDNLGQGVWSRTKVDILSPLLPDTIVGVEAFADAEIRHIRAQKLDGGSANIRSWRTGLTLRLPMEGESETPDWLESSVPEGDNQVVKGISHKMEWSTTISARPEVGRDSDYAALDGNQSYRTYLVSDAERLAGTTGLSSVVDRADAMQPHQRIEFATSHRWLFFSRQWNLIPADRLPDSSNNPIYKNYLDRARQELLFSTDRSVGGVDDMFSTVNSTTQWFINRYNYQTTGEAQFLSFGARIGYDFLEAKRRDDLNKAQSPEAANARAWDNATFEASLNAFGSTLSSIGNYDIYDHLFEKSEHYLTPPALWSTQAKLGFLIARSSPTDRTVTRTLGISTGLIPNIGLAVDLSRRQQEAKDNPNIQTYSTVYSLGYVSPTDCWQLSFVRNKPFDKLEAEAVYVLQLDMLFLGQKRPVVNFFKSDNTLRTLNLR